jgi:putative colanic acid biosynthesis UDP-glucose lipid carrier transferase
VASLQREAAQVLSVWLPVVLGLTAVAFLTKTSAHLSRLVVLYWFLLTPALLILERLTLRLALRALRRRGRNTRTLAIVGAGRLAQQVAESVRAATWTGLRLVGLYDDRSPVRLPPHDGEPVKLHGNLAQLVERARAGEVDYVYITLSMRGERRIIELVDALADTTASVYLVPDVFVYNLLHARWTNMDGVTMVSIFETPFYGVDGWLKRLEDLVLGSLILLVVALPMLAIAAAVKLSSPGPVLFKQRRYGLNGKVVEVWKFRTMTCCEDGSVVPQATRDDARVTPLGAFLRRASLDELPQFINVLQGRMSIVGPCPHAVSHNEQYRKLIRGYMLRHKVKPGITGWAQINGLRGETDTLDKMRARVEYDMTYIRQWTLGFDLRIIIKTLTCGFVNRNAY